LRQRADAIHIEREPKGTDGRFPRGRDAAAGHRTLSKTCRGGDHPTQEDVDDEVEDERVPKEWTFGAIVDSREIDFRVHSMPTSYGESLALRVLDRATLIPMDRLGFSPAALSKVREMMGKRAA